MRADPVVSVCIPAFRAEAYVRAAVESALAQAGPSLEVVVYDDASPDGTLAALAGLEDPRLRLFRQRTNVGIARNRNSCLAVARGRYVAWLDADDLLHADALARGVAVLDRLPRVGLLHGGHHVIGDDGRRLPDWPAPFAHDVVERGPAAFEELLLSNYVTASTTLVRRDCHRTLGGYDARLTASGEDWEMWLRIALRHDVAYLASPLASYRRHTASATAGSSGTRLGVRLDRAVVDAALARRRELHPSDRDRQRRRAYTALAAKALQAAGRAYVSGSTEECVAATLTAYRLAPRLLASRAAWLLPLAQVRSDDYACFTHSRELLALAHRILSGSRFAASLEKHAVPDRAWNDELSAVAGVVRSCVPPQARVAAVDKHDPTLLHLARRRGWHVPDLRLLPGYPRDGAEAVAHLEALRARGASHLVLPSHAFWWLDHYTELAGHLDSYQALWSDERCRIYALAERTG